MRNIVSRRPHLARHASLIVAGVLATAGLAGCASQPPIPIAPLNAPTAPSFSRVLVVDNSRPSGSMVVRPYGAGAVRLKNEPWIGSVIASDLRAQFPEGPGPEGLSLRVTIQDAQQFSEYSVIDSIPIVGISTSMGPKPYVATARLLFEVERNGRVERSYMLDQRTTISHTLIDNKDARDGQALLFDAFRHELAQRIQSEFIARYL